MSAHEHLPTGGTAATGRANLRKQITTLALAAGVLFTSVASGQDSRYDDHRHHGGIGPGKGALIGGAGGAGIGALAGGGKGALIGGAIGAGGGALVGKANANRRHRRYRRDHYGRHYR